MVDTPAFTVPLHVGRPNLGDRAALHARLDQLLDRRWLSNGGPLVEEFEAAVARTGGVRHAVAVCNATAGLQLLLRALELRGEVILPSFTFVATAHAASWSGLTPVFCDVDPITHNLDSGAVEALINKRTSAVLGVHLWGGSCDVPALTSVAERHGLALAFDAAHAFGCASPAGPTGSGGLAEVFSFHATKFVNAFEGGAVVTDDDALAAELRLLRNFGFADYDTVVRGGTNAKMSEMSAAMGLTSLEAAASFVEANLANARIYQAELREIAGLRVLEQANVTRSNHQYVVLEVDSAVTGVHRDDVLAELQCQNVLARRYFYPGCHRMAPYSGLQTRSDHLPVTERLCDQVLVLPTGSAVSPADARLVSHLVREVVAGA